MADVEVDDDLVDLLRREIILRGVLALIFQLLDLFLRENVQLDAYLLAARERRVANALLLRVAAGLVESARGG